MKTLITVAVMTLMSGLAGATDFTDLQRLNTSDIPKVNPFPNPGNPDSCYLTGLKDGLCNFKCLSGETFQVKPVKPEAASVYAKCGGGDYRGVSKTLSMNMTLMIPLQRAKMASNTLRTIALSLQQPDGSNTPPAEYAEGVLEVSEAVSEGLMDIDAAIKAGDSLEVRHQAVLMEPHLARLTKLSDAIEDSVNYFIWHGPRVLDVATQLKRDMNEVRINAPFAF